MFSALPKLAFKSVLVFLVTVLLVVFTAEARPLDPITPEEMNLRLSELQGSRWAGEAKEEKNGSLGRCSRSNVTIGIADPYTKLERPLVLDVVRPRKGEKHPVVIVVPTIEGHTVIETSTASKLCQLGIAAIVADVNINDQPGEMPAWGYEDFVNRLGILSLRSVIDYAESNAHFDSSRIGMMGLSFGAITSSMMAGIEPERLRALMLVVGGGNLPYIISISDNSKLNKLRDRRFEYLGISTSEQYEEELRKTVRFDPMYFTPRAQRDRLFMVMSNSDSKVPTSMQKDLFNAFGQPENTVFNVGHVETIVALTYFYFEYVGDYFVKQFGLEKSRALHLQAKSLNESPIPAWAKPPTAFNGSNL